MGDKTKTDMLEGPILPRLILFAFPVFVSSLLQQLFNAADTAVVGRFAGSIALAAVGSNGSIISLLVSLFVGLSLGANVIVARFLGAGEEDKVREAVPTIMIVSVICGVALATLGFAAATPILRLVDSPEEVLPLSALYLRVYFLGMPFPMIYNFGSAILRSCGDTKRPLYALTLAGVVNVILNLVFVVCFNMSVLGVALATVISNAVSAAIVLVFLLRHPGPVRLELQGFRFQKSVVGNMFRIGIPAGLQGTLFSVSNVVVLSAVNSFGPYCLAGASIAGNFENISFFVCSSMNQATVTFTSQNYGARNYDRCRRIYAMAMLSSHLIQFALDMVMLLFLERLMLIFNTDPNALEFARTRLTLILFTHCLLNSYETPGSCLRGLGWSKTPTVITFLCCCCSRLLWVYFVLPRNHTYPMLLILYPISWLLGGIVMNIAYFAITRKVFNDKAAAA